MVMLSGIRPQKFFHYAFDAGENKGEAPTFFSKAELDRTLNVINLGNGITTRLGSSIVTLNGSDLPDPISGNPDILSMHGIAYGTSNYDALFTAGSSIYRDVASPVELKTGLTSSLRFQGQQAGDIFYLTNGTDDVQFYDPNRSTSQTYTAGYDTPASFTATPSAVGGSMATGTYEYYVTLYDENTRTESNRQDAAVSAVVTGPTGSVSLTNLPLDSEDRTTHWIIYRKDPSGFYHYKIDKVVYNASIPTYSDTEASTGSQVIAPDDNFRPDPSDGMCLHGNIMVYFKGNTLTWGKNYRHQNVPTENREILEDNSQKIVRCISYRKTLVIWKTDSIYAITGDLNRGNYAINRISGTIGTRSPMTVCEAPDGIYFLDNFKRPRFINSTDFAAEDLRDSTDISFKYRKKFDLVSQSTLENCFAVLWESSAVSQYRLFVPVDTSDSYPNHCFVYDIGLSRRNGGDSAWFDLRYNISMVSASVATIFGGVKTIYVGDDYGLVWQLEIANQYYDGGNVFRAEGADTITIGATTIICDSLAMTTNEHVGKQLILYNAYTYNEIFRSRITANTATQFTVADTIPTLETDDPAVCVGGYLTYFATSHYTHNRAERCRPYKASVLFSFEYGATSVQFFTHYDFNEAFNYTYDYMNNLANTSLTPLADNYTLIIGDLSTIYDDPAAIYDTARYGYSVFGTQDFPLKSEYLFKHVSWGVVTREPAQPFSYLGATIFYQPKGLTDTTE